MDVFTALADPTRRAMLDLLTGGARPAGDLVAAFPALTQPAISRHLRVLREVGLVDVRAQAQRRIYTLRTEPLSEVDAWLGRYRDYWARHLDAIEAHLAAPPGQGAHDDR
ncbi:transcriptional regulator, ArsR family [Asanoa ishikariensis]|uniref:Transcriptional regulator, ArsR family n=1 Tax=Asanoa ishikariensis TaxID=137265 RepID=A0A1H3TBZ1_9ACTN|nr:metalloregulator ArsR/SmtB family transcription factor [Asanoa ishikariensis]SDZ47225.1 transcriptional regulator, ArsR family [Asanoa ishikariensis]